MGGFTTVSYTTYMQQDELDGVFFFIFCMYAMFDYAVEVLIMVFY